LKTWFTSSRVVRDWEEGTGVMRTYQSLVPLFHPKWRGKVMVEFTEIGNGIYLSKSQGWRRKGGGSGKTKNGSEDARKKGLSVNDGKGNEKEGVSRQRSSGLNPKRNPG